MLLTALAPLVALYPLARVQVEWQQVRREAPEAAASVSARGYDWVRWEDRGGQIVAAYVFPRGPAAEAGLREGDVFLSLEGQILFDVRDLERVVAGLAPGSQVAIEVVREGETTTLDVPITRYPTFVYPLSAGLWSFALWGFVVAAFLHIVGIATALPLARTSVRARYALAMIALSALWIVGNLARLLLVEVVGPPGRPGGASDQAFQALTLVGLAGWIAFPAVLLANAARVSGASARYVRATHLLRLVAPLTLGGLAVATTLGGSVGPHTLDLLVAPLVFYSAVYIALAALIPIARPERASDLPGGFSRAGSALTALAATAAAVAVSGIGTVAGDVGTVAVGAVVVVGQLLSLAPILLVTVETLRHGKVDDVLTRALTTLIGGGLFFFAFTGTLVVLDPLLQRRGASATVAAALVGVAIFLVLERTMRRLRQSPPRWLATERQRMRARVAAFQETMQGFVDADALASETVRVAAEAVGARSAMLAYRLPSGRHGAAASAPGAPADPWRTARYRPEPPLLTLDAVTGLFDALPAEAGVWARRAELRELVLTNESTRRFEAVGAHVAVPIVGETAPVGLLVVAAKRVRRSVYTLDDLDVLRSLAASFGLAAERLALIEREKELARQHAEAQLVALRAQINPHFLFNALNTIAALIDEQPTDAEDAVEHLAAIFRHTLRTAGAATVPLGAELALVRHYLAIETARFGDRLAVTIQVPDAALDVEVPAFAVQTLVENAVKHGLEPSRGRGHLRIGAERGSDALVVTVADDGVGIPALYGAPESTAHHGTGLSNVADRLARLYGLPGLLRHDSRPGAGTWATMRVPLAGWTTVDGRRTMGDVNVDDAERRADARTVRPHVGARTLVLSIAPPPPEAPLPAQRETLPNDQPATRRWTPIPPAPRGCSGVGVRILPAASRRPPFPP